jgi:hypothetical protein
LVAAGGDTGAPPNPDSLNPVTAAATGDLSAFSAGEKRVAINSADSTRFAGTTADSSAGAGKATATASGTPPADPALLPATGFAADSFISASLNASVIGAPCESSLGKKSKPMLPSDARTSELDEYSESPDWEDCQE